MARIETLLHPDERIMWRGRFGTMRLVYEVVCLALLTGLATLFAPLAFFIVIFALTWLYSERGLQKVVVTNRRIIHKRGWIRPKIDELNLSRIESVRNNGQRITVIGSGGTRLKLPLYLKDEAGLGRALHSGGETISAPPGSGPLMGQGVPPSVANSVPAHDHLDDGVAPRNPSAAQGVELSLPGQKPFWKKAVFLVPAIFTVLVAPYFIMEPSADRGAGASSAYSDAHMGPQSSDASEGEAFAPAPSDEARSDKLPAIVDSYRETALVGDEKRSVVVHLKAPVDEATLAEIGKRIRRQNFTVFRTFITYYLPGMKEGAGAWGVTNFDPGMKVQILGLSKEATEQAQAKPVLRDVLGRWLDNRPAIGAVMTIRKHGTSFKLHRKFKDGSTMTEGLTERGSSDGRRFDIKTASGIPEYLIITPQNRLQVFDDEGLIFTAQPINNS